MMVCSIIAVLTEEPIAIGMALSFLCTILLATGMVDTNVTPNKTLYEQNVSVNINSYKKWVINHEAELAKERLK